MSNQDIAVALLCLWIALIGIMVDYVRGRARKAHERIDELERKLRDGGFP